MQYIAAYKGARKKGAMASEARHEKSESYTLQGSAYQQSMVARRAEQQAAFFLPYLHPGMRLVDCGSGPGSITLGLARQVAPGQVTGIDIDAAQVEKANALAAEQGVTNVRFERGSVYELPFADASVDAVFSNALLQHLGDPVAALREMYRILKPGGIIGARTIDVDGSLTYPADERTHKLREWLDQLQREQGHNNRLGKELRGLAHRVGFVRTIATASYDRFGTLEEIRNVANAFASFALKGWAPEQILARGWADQAELEAIAGLILEWGNNPDAFYAAALCEVVGWRG
jgi:ubiquinone/menaquinone biosynthesis C-methylase UbiE